MPDFTVTSCMPANTSREWTNPKNGQTTVFHNYNVQFAETPGQSWQIGRTANQQPPMPGQKISGEFQTSQNGRQYFKEVRQQQSNGWGGGQTGKFGGRGASTTGKEIMAQVALKEAVTMAIAQQKFDPQAVDFFATAYMETMVKIAGLKVEAPVPPSNGQPQPPVAQPTNGYPQPTNRVAQFVHGAQQPQQGYATPPGLFQPPQQQQFAGNEFNQDEIPF